MADNRFRGKERALRRMREIPVAVRREARKQLDEAGADLVQRIRPAVPVEEGELRDSVEWHRNPRGDKIGVVVTEGAGQEGDPLNRKARAVEFGRDDMAAQPHFHPTYRANKRRLMNKAMRGVRAVVRAIWGRG